MYGRNFDIKGTPYACMAFSLLLCGEYISKEIALYKISGNQTRLIISTRSLP
jgi:hypothetical protein